MTGWLEPACFYCDIQQNAIDAKSSLLFSVPITCLDLFVKITKTKLAAASFGAALTSLYAAPDLAAQDTSSEFDEPISFFPTTVPFSFGTNFPDGFYSTGIAATVIGLTSNFGYGYPIVWDFFNNGNYGFGAIGASVFETVGPGELWSGTVGADSFLSIGPGSTGIHTVGFIETGGVGYFRVDLGPVPNGTVTLLDGEISLGPNGVVDSDFAITIPEPDGNVILGDIDGDGDVDFEDIPGFISLLTGGGFQAEADIDMDGDVDFEDIPLFIQLLTGGSVNTQAGLPGLAMGADGLRGRRMAATA